MRQTLRSQKGVVCFFLVSTISVLVSLTFALAGQKSKSSEVKIDREQTQGAQDITPKINEYMDALVKAGKFNGSALIARDGKLLISKGYGMANFELDVPNTPQTKFRLGS